MPSPHDLPAAATFTRRRFLLSAAATGACLIGRPRVFAAETPPLQKVTRTTFAMGTKMSLTALHPDPKIAAAAIETAWSEIAIIDQVMSLYQPDSQICQLNSAGRLADPHPCLVEILRAADEISRATDGAFDVSVQPLWEIYAAAKKRDERPDSAAVEHAKRLVDYRKLSVTQREITLGPGQKITLNGIAQGYAADSAVAALRKHGIANALINTGEVAAIGRRMDGEPWTVGIQHPRIGDAYVAIAPLQDQSMATSGDYQTTFTEDRISHHIFDPHTGRSPGELASVSVVGPSATTADALATAIFVLGHEKGVKLLEQFQRMSALFVFKDGSVQRTADFPGE